ncbi:hypothetical protein D3C87_1785420 [compost metagenome]
MQTLIDLEGPASQPDELRRIDRLGPAAHAPQPLLHVEGCNIAPDRRLGTVGQIDQFRHRDHGLFLNRRQNDPMSFFLVHPLLR